MNEAWPFEPPFDVAEQAILSSARQHSLVMLEQLRERLRPLSSQAPEVMSVAVSGSLGRLEALAHSDCDLLVVTRGNEGSKETGDSRATTEKVWSLLEPLGFPPPDHDGIFSKAVSVDRLCNPSALGSLDEAKTVFGKRMQLLLDCKPVYQPGRFAELHHSILNWYSTGYLEHGSEKQWTYLLNDLTRYLHSYSAWKQFDFGDGERESWYTLQLKLRTSRLLAFAGLLLLLGQSSNRTDDKLGWLHSRLSLTPLERVALVFAEYEDGGFRRIADGYEKFMSAMDDGKTRQQLLDTAPRSIAELERAFDPVYAHLHKVTGVIASELTRFILERRADWNPRFFQYYLL